MYDLFENSWHIVVAIVISIIVFPIASCTVKQAEMRHDTEIHCIQVNCHVTDYKLGV